MNVYALILVFCIPGTFANCPPRISPTEQVNAITINNLSQIDCHKLQDFYNDNHIAYASCIVMTNE